MTNLLLGIKTDESLAVEESDVNLRTGCTEPGKAAGSRGRYRTGWNATRRNVELCCVKNCLPALTAATCSSGGDGGQLWRRAHTRRRTAVGRLSSPGVLALKTWLGRSRTIHTRRCVPIYPHRLLGIAMSLFWEHSTEGLLRAESSQGQGAPSNPDNIGVGLR